MDFLLHLLSAIFPMKKLVVCSLDLPTVWILLLGFLRCHLTYVSDPCMSLVVRAGVLYGLRISVFLPVCLEVVCGLASEGP